MIGEIKKIMKIEVMKNLLVVCGQICVNQIFEAVQ